MTAALQRVGRASSSVAAGYELGQGSATSLEELENLGLGADGLGKLGAAQMERLRLTREAQPHLIIQAHEREVQRDLSVLPGEPWSFARHARERVLPSAAGHHGLRKTVTILAHALDLHRTAGAEQSRAFLQQAYKAAQAAAYHPQKQWTYGWPLLGVEDPDGQARPGFTASEHAALAAFHRDRELLTKHLGTSASGSAPGGGASSSRGGGGAATPLSGDEATKSLRTELDKLRKELAAERKKTAKGEKGAKGRGRGAEEAPDR